MDLEPKPQRIVIVGAGGRLGAALQRIYGEVDEVVGFNHAQLDLALPATIRAKIEPLEFDVMINCAAQTNVDRCESEQKEAFTINGEAPGVLAALCAEKGARLIHISTDYVFDGAKAEPYTEADAAEPISVYGASKLAGEEAVLAADGRHLVARVSWIFGPDRPSFVDWIVERARTHEQVEAVADKFSTPTYTLDIAGMLRPFLGERATTAGASLDENGLAAGGILHLANRGQCSWREYGQHALDCCAAAGVLLRAHTVGAIALRDMKNFVARRPIHTALSSAKFEALTGYEPRDWREAVSAYIRDHLAT